MFSAQCFCHRASMSAKGYPPVRTSAPVSATSATALARVEPARSAPRGDGAGDADARRGSAGGEARARDHGTAAAARRRWRPIAASARERDAIAAERRAASPAGADAAVTGRARPAGRRSAMPRGVGARETRARSL